MTYQCQYFTMYSSISECDHTCKSRNAEPRIGPGGSSQTRRNLRVDKYGSEFGPPRVRRKGFWPGVELNRPLFAVQTRTAGGLPGPVANTIHWAAMNSASDHPHQSQPTHRSPISQSWPCMIHTIPHLWSHNSSMNLRSQRDNANTVADLVLRMGPGSQPAVRVSTGGSVRSGSKPSQKPDPLCVGRVVTWTGQKSALSLPGISCSRDSSLRT